MTCLPGKPRNNTGGINNGNKQLSITTDDKGNPMKRMISLVLILTLAVMALLPAQAEEFSQTDIYKTLYLKAVVSVFKMQAKAINTEWTDRQQQFYAERFAQTDAGHPSAVAVFALNDSDLEEIWAITGCGYNSGVLSALNQKINGQYSSAYPLLMDSIAPAASGISLFDPFTQWS